MSKPWCSSGYHACLLHCSSGFKLRSGRYIVLHMIPIMTVLCDWALSSVACIMYETYPYPLLISPVVEWVTCSPGTPLTQIQSWVGGYIVTTMIAIMAVPCHGIFSGTKKNFWWETLIKIYLEWVLNVDVKQANNFLWTRFIQLPLNFENVFNYFWKFIFIFNLMLCI